MRNIHNIRAIQQQVHEYVNRLGITVAENGSGGWISDITVEGGLYGFLGGNQQYSVSNLAVRSAKNGVGLIWDWAWVSSVFPPKNTFNCE